MYEKLRNVLKTVECHILLFFISLIVFIYPIIMMSGVDNPITILLSFFLPWAIVIFVLFLASRSYSIVPRDLTHAEEKEVR